jgi:uncharacterized Fe-S cluster-containing radical SAM superfamily protein
MKTIDTAKFSTTLRAKAIDTENKRVLITRLSGSEQEKDLSEPPNCGGYGRIRHFRRETAKGWPENPLPIDPAANRLGLARTDILEAQVFQNAACNWRCWYCYVPFNLLSANEKNSGWLTARDLVDLYRASDRQPKVIDLSGGQPDLTPEWIPWMMKELRRQDLHEAVYLWSDDNLSNDYFWQILTPEEIETVRTHRNYGKVCCFKGFDAESFAFNTSAAAELFNQQFDLFRRYITLGIDLYAYATFTSPPNERVDQAMSSFVDKLQDVHVNLPLRTVPLEIRAFSPMESRLGDRQESAIKVQNEAIQCWNMELARRFSSQERDRPIYEVELST